MSSSIFGWSYPPGCNGTPYDEEQAIDLTDGRTIKGHGRSQHGLNGKDADLDPGGQNHVKEAWWLDDGTIIANGRRYASICGDEDWSEETWNAAAELVMDCQYSGEWDGDYWILGEDYTIKAHLDWDDTLTDEQNIAKACEVAVEAISKDSQAFEACMSDLLHSMDTLEKDIKEWEEGADI